jgi:hypothetical protein
MDYTCTTKIYFHLYVSSWQGQLTKIYSNYFIESIFFIVKQSAKLEFYQRICAFLFPLLAKVQYCYFIIYRILCDSILNSNLLTRTIGTKGDGNTTN